MQAGPLEEQRRKDCNEDDSKLDPQQGASKRATGVESTWRFQVKPRGVRGRYVGRRFRTAVETEPAGTLQLQAVRALMAIVVRVEDPALQSGARQSMARLEPSWRQRNLHSHQHPDDYNLFPVCLVSIPWDLHHLRGICSTGLQVPLLGLSVAQCLMCCGLRRQGSPLLRGPCRWFSGTKYATHVENFCLSCFVFGEITVVKCVQSPVLSALFLGSEFVLKLAHLESLCAPCDTCLAEIF